MTKRIYSYYDSSNEYPELEKAASERGMTVSSFQKYAVLLQLYGDVSKRASAISMPQLLTDMNNALNNLTSGQKFITSALFDPNIWTNLSASEKRTLSCNLKKIVDKNPNLYKLISRVPGKINQYEKI